MLRQILPPSVQIVLEREGRRVRTNSGVVIAARSLGQNTESECYVLTSGHTFTRTAGDEAVYVLLDRQRGPGMRVPATVLAHRDTPEIDLALLRARTPGCPAAVLGQPPVLGEAIWVVAFPWGRNMTLVGGIVSQVNEEGRTDPEVAPRLMVDASVSYGASGGGVYEADTGHLVGLIEGYRTARVSFRVETHPGHIDVPVPGETYVVPLAAIRRFLEETGFRQLIAPPARANGRGHEPTRVGRPLP